MISQSRLINTVKRVVFPFLFKFSETKQIEETQRKEDDIDESDSETVKVIFNCHCSKFDK